MVQIQQKSFRKGTTYFYVQGAGILGEIKGPFMPGSVWSLEVYQIKNEEQFREAWKEGKLTPVQRGKCTLEQDRIFAAMCMGSTNGVDPELLEGHSKCLGYTIKRKRDAITKFAEYLEKEGIV